MMRLPLATSLRSLPLLLVLLLAHLLPATGQGLAPNNKAALGASGTSSKLKSVYAKASSFAALYRQNPKGACSQQRGSLCASNTNLDDVAVLTVAVSPPRFDARSKGLVSRVGQQGACSTCLSFSLIGAAEAAVAAALGQSATSKAWSVQHLHFCVLPKPGQVVNCRNAEVTQAKDEIEAFIQMDRDDKTVFVEGCMPYTAEGKTNTKELCKPKCNDVDPDVGLGTFSYKPLSIPWDVQQHIRTYGGVITRLDIYTDFEDFFDEHPDGTYPGPGPDAELKFGHAVVLVGYDNVNNYYIFKNSWGQQFGRDGFGKISYAATKTGLLNPGDTFGLVFDLKQPRTIPLRLVDVSGRQGCYTCTPPYGTWLSDLAVLLQVDVRSLVADNVDQVQAIDQPLDGRTSILVCDVSDDVLSLTIGRAPATGSGDDEAGNGGDDGSTGDAMDAGYITLTFTNECYAGTIVAAVMHDDEKMEDTEPNWVTDGFWTMKPGETVTVAKTVVTSYYVYANFEGDPNCDYQICWTGTDAEGQLDNQTYGFVEASMLEGTQMGTAWDEPFLCADLTNALWVKWCATPTDEGNMCFSYVAQGLPGRKVYCFEVIADSVPRVKRDDNDDVIQIDTNQPVYWKWDGSEADWSKLNKSKFMSGYLVEFDC